MEGKKRNKSWTPGADACISFLHGEKGEHAAAVLVPNENVQFPPLFFLEKKDNKKSRSFLQPARPKITMVYMLSKDISHSIVISCIATNVKAILSHGQLGVY